MFYQLYSPQGLQTWSPAWPYGPNPVCPNCAEKALKQHPGSTGIPTDVAGQCPHCGAYYDNAAVSFDSVASLAGKNTQHEEV